MPKDKKPKEDKHLAWKMMVADEMPREKVAEALDVSPSQIRKWESEILPDGSGVNKAYEQMTSGQLDEEFEKAQAVAKMCLIDRIITLSRTERDLGKLSGAIKDINSVAKGEVLQDTKIGAWSEYVQSALKQIKKKPITINNNTLNIHAKGED